jgi:hypothetical protein
MAAPGSARVGADWAAGARAGHELPVAYHEGAVDQDVLDTGRWAGALGVARLVADRGRIQDHDVSVAADLQPALAAQGWNPVLQQPGRAQAGFAQRLGQAERSAIPREQA